MQNYPTTATLRMLDLSHNVLADQGSDALGQWLAYMEDVSQLERIYLASTELRPVPILNAIRQIRYGE